MLVKCVGRSDPCCSSPSAWAEGLKFKKTRRGKSGFLFGLSLRVSEPTETPKAGDSERRVEHPSLICQQQVFGQDPVQDGKEISCISNQASVRLLGRISAPSCAPSRRSPGPALPPLPLSFLSLDHQPAHSPRPDPHVQRSSRTHLAVSEISSLHIARRHLSFIAPFPKTTGRPTPTPASDEPPSPPSPPCFPSSLEHHPALERSVRCPSSQSSSRHCLHLQRKRSRPPLLRRPVLLLFNLQPYHPLLNGATVSPPPSPSFEHPLDQVSSTSLNIRRKELKVRSTGWVYLRLTFLDMSDEGRMNWA